MCTFLMQIRRKINQNETSFESGLGNPILMQNAFKIHLIQGFSINMECLLSLPKMIFLSIFPTFYSLTFFFCLLQNQEFLL